MNNEPLAELERRRLQRQMFALEDEKEAVEARYKYLLQQARVGLFSLNAKDCRLKDANSEMISMFLCSDLEDLKQHLTPLSAGDIHFIDPRHFANLKATEAVSFSLHSFRKNGDSFWARIILQALEKNEILEGIITDISDQVKADVELRKAIVQAEQARKEAEEANNAKSRFLANISHEIRTPLNGIIGFTEIIMASIASLEGQLYAGKILDESDNLMTLINQLLDISKIEAQQLELNNSVFNLRTLLEETISFIRLRARNKGLTLAVEYDESIPDCIWSDSYRLRQILLNLLSNAVKFTSRGGVEMKAILQEQEGDELVLRFEVHDTGIGIPQDMHLKVFDSFVQADSSISRHYGGTGLGISISREIVNIMNGKIWFDSVEGEGSTFFFTIPCQEADPMNPGAPRLRRSAPFIKTSLVGLRVLVVEDYPTNREIAQHHLQSAGCDVDMAANGISALSKVQDRDYDIILMDVHMPEMDGMEATRKIRSFPRYKMVPILGMTANVLPANLQDCRRSGMNDILTKPLRKKEMLESLEIWYTLGDTKTLPSVNKPGSPLEPQDDLDDLPFDYAGFLEQMEGDAGAARDIILGFMDNLIKQMDVIAESIERDDLILIHREAHSIKGGALNLGASELASWAMALEKAGAEKYTEIIPHLFLNLRNSVAEILSCRDRISLIG
ncbi:ATP-binding protein [Oceanispirochaeta sp.]|jgi:signal transduction histidine kinase/HPt (histidine-containing phosphotransfer) domain-containing protein/ActR/RegA family two-component response regulator|uniref:ATP-binding protein n=1 Tax=Oceanispirochaeta sp. TaxID=2035350 RepID=UPI002613169C|nr:ATP-binding protein [Oceanispirochaeta sp.]MDA3958340.1 ATP-binding protein [Oceanispirochaeta sp.]